MEHTLQTLQTLQTYLQNPEAIDNLVKAAMAGDKAVLQEVKAFLDASSQWSEELGNLWQHTENTLLDLSVGKNLFEREAIQRTLDAHKQRLAEEPSYVETLLIKRSCSTPRLVQPS